MIAHRIQKGDLRLDNGTTVIIDGKEYARQRVEISLDFLLGEWFLDTRQGVPYFRDVLIRKPNDETVRSVLRRTVLNTPGMVRVDSLSTQYDTTARKLIVTYEATYQDGTSVPGVSELIL